MASLKLMLVCAVLVMAVITTTSARLYLLEVDDGSWLPYSRRTSTQRRQDEDDSNSDDKVVGDTKWVRGGVYSFVKTNSKGHFKWGVRHPAGRLPPNVRPAAAVRVRRSPHEGVVGPVYTHVKTDKHANFKWGVKHHVGKQYAG